MKVADVNIADDYITVKGTETALDVAKALTNDEIPDAVVIDEEGKVLGALDDFDLVSQVMALEKDPTTVTASDIMFTSPSVTLQTNLEEAESMMQDLEATILPVVDEDKKLIGVLTIMDVLEGLAKAHEPRKGVLSFLRGLF